MKRSMSLPAVALAIAGAACANRGDAQAPERSPSSATSAQGEEGAPPAHDAAPALPVAEDRGPEHAVYSLADNRLAAHVGRSGGLLVHAGSAGFAKYLRFARDRNPWELGQEQGGVKVARMSGPRANLRVPLTEEQAAGEVAISLRVHTPAARRLSIAVGGEELHAELEEGWSTVAVAAPAGRLRAGENDLEIIARPGPALELAWLQVGGGEAQGDPDPIFADGALRIPEDGELFYYVMVPEDGRVTGDLDEIGCEVEVEAVADGGEAVRGALVGRGSAVKLGELGGQVVRLSLSASGCATAALTNAALAVPGPAPSFERGEAPPPRYVMLWIMDSLRADRLRPINPDARPKTPVLDELAKRAAVFTQAYVQGNESRASHASIWSSLYGAKHGMPQQTSRLADRWTTIDQAMKAAGKFTSGVSGNGYVTARWGFGTQWDRYRNHIHLEAGLQGDQILGQGLRSVADVDGPWFLYVGTIDTHVSWRAKEPWMSMYDPEPYEGRFRRSAPGPLIDRIAAGQESINQRDIVRIRAIYDSNVSYQDMLLGELFEWLEERGIAEETMLIISADHGDELWEVGRVGHGGSLRDSVVHVPLVVYYPPLVPGGRITEGAEVIDILPTFADALGLEPDPEWQGESLIPLAHGVSRGYPRMSIASLYGRAHAGRAGPWKLRAQGRETPQLFNVGEEPEEKTDVVDDYPFARRFVADALWTLRTHNVAWNKREWGNAANMRAAFPAAMGE
jgi:arylsulfatase A-like enzyme